MTSGTVQRYFYDACVPIKYRCTVNTHYIDPCDCTSYYLCETQETIIPRQCSPGTAFDHNRKTCRRLNDVVLDGLCDQASPWTRCSQVDDYDDVDLAALEARCTNTTVTTTPSPQGDGGGVDGGLIAGVIIAVLIVIIIAVALVIYIRKKGNPIKQLKEARGQVRGQQSVSRHGHTEEETYAEIDDTAIYKAPSEGSTLGPSLSHSNETYDVEEGVAYDNPALSRDTPPPPPTPPHPDSCPVPEDYSTLEQREHVPRSYASLNEHRAGLGDVTVSIQPTTGDDGYLMAEVISDSQRSSGPSDPNYFVLEKS